METEEALILIEKYLNGTATAREMALLESFLISRMDRPENTASPEFLQRAFLENYRLILQRSQLSIENPQTRSLSIRRLRALVAMAAIVLITFGIYFMAFKRSPNSHLPADGGHLMLDDVAAGSNKATLTLADGRKIVLDPGQSSIVIGDKVVKYGNGVSVPGVILPAPGVISGSEAEGLQKGENHTNEGRILQLSTPRGGQYRVVLSDGTQVWLNAASTLRYPSRFSGGQRVVELDGEGYFLVAKSEKQKTKNQEASTPFVVKSRGQETVVLGTEFNVCAYENENSVRTTLVNGKVRVSRGADGKAGTGLLLQPGEQSVYAASGTIYKSAADLAAMTAWKKGDFYFKNTPFANMMQQIARWYDIEVVYQSRVPTESFSGEMSREVSLRAVLRLLNASEIAFKIEGKRLIIE